MTKLFSLKCWKLIRKFPTIFKLKITDNQWWRKRPSCIAYRLPSCAIPSSIVCTFHYWFFRCFHCRLAESLAKGLRLYNYYVNGCTGLGSIRTRDLPHTRRAFYPLDHPMTANLLSTSIIYFQNASGMIFFYKWLIFMLIILIFKLKLTIVTISEFLPKRLNICSKRSSRTHVKIERSSAFPKKTLFHNLVSTLPSLFIWSRQFAMPFFTVSCWKALECEVAAI